MATSASSPGPTPPSPSPAPADQPVKWHGTPPLLHNTSLLVAIVAPIAFFTPPRTGFRNLILASGTFWATSQLTYDWTGKSIYQRSSERLAKLTANELPPEAQRVRAAIQAERERRAATEAHAQGISLEDFKQRKFDSERTLFHKMWYGKETKYNWKEERIEKERKALEEGKGYSDLIIQHFRDAWGSKDEDDLPQDSATDKPADTTQPPGGSEQPKK